MKLIPVDVFGRPYKVGDYFVMALRLGDRAEMKVGRVLDFYERKYGYYPEKTAIKPKIRTVEATWSGDKLRLCRSTVMECPERSYIVPERAVPEKYLNLLGPLVDAKSVLRIQNSTICPRCGTSVVQTSHGPYCPMASCKWGWETEMDGSPLKLPETSCPAGNLRCLEHIPGLGCRVTDPPPGKDMAHTYVKLNPEEIEPEGKIAD